MNIFYTRLFNFSIRHSYYEHGIPKGIHIFPNDETMKLLTGGRMLFKTFGGGASVLFRTLDDETTPLVNLGKDNKFTFGISLENKSEFLNITNLDELPSKKFSSFNIFYLSNNPTGASTDPDAPELLSYELLDFVHGKLYTYQIELETHPAQVLFRFSNENGLISVGKNVDGTPFDTTLTLDRLEDNSYTQQVDIRNLPSGRYKMEIRNIADTETLMERQVFVDDQLQGSKISGIVDITYDSTNGHIYGNTEEYRISFASKTSLWKYYIVNKSNSHDFSSDNITLIDAGGATGPYTSNTFPLSGAAPNADIRINDNDTLIYISNTEIPFYEIPKISLQLKKNGATDPFLNDLPNPMHSGLVKDESSTASSEIYVFI